ncbi:hypothetical protein L218DRAFT_761039 [Marasmius fiardii PR-910]|nr:hypothetical protein L218DRAFT_761039 [Marasmius fiardii PR-910]
MPIVSFDTSPTIISSSLSSAASGPSVTTTSRTDGNSSASGSSKINTGAIIGGVTTGVLGFLVSVAAAIFLRRRRRQMQEKRYSVTPEPFAQSLHTYTRSKGSPGPWRQLQDRWSYLPTVGSSSIIHSPTTPTRLGSISHSSPAVPLTPQRNLVSNLEDPEPAGPPGPPPAYEE